MKLTLALVVVASIDLLSSVCHAERILFLAPVATKSHKNAFMPILEALAERGHQVTLVSTFESKKQVKNIREIVVEDSYNDRDFDWLDRGSQGPWAALVGIINDFRSFNTGGYKNIMANDDFHDVLRSKNVDLAIIDATVNDFCYPIIDYLKVPFISYIPSAGIPWTIYRC